MAHPAPPGPPGALCCRLAGAKRIEAVLKPEAAAALADLRERTGSTYSAIIEGLLLAEHGMRGGSHPKMRRTT